MRQDLTPEKIGQRFHCPPVPSLIARTDLKQPIIFSQVVSNHGMSDPTLPPPVENALSLHVHHRAVEKTDIWIQGRHALLNPVEPGSVLLFDLRGEPTALVEVPFEFSRFHLSRSALDELAYENDVPRLGDVQTLEGEPDPVLRQLALALMQYGRLHGAGRDTLFQDAVTRALFVHIATKYAGATVASRATWALAPWQLNRVIEWVDANLEETISVADLARLVGLSPSYFSRAFIKSVGLPPHRWLLQRRIARAKVLMTTTVSSIVEIAVCAGFVDQSHFTRVFKRVIGTSPSRWRRNDGSSAGRINHGASTEATAREGP